MTLEEAIKIVDPATRREALYIYDPEERKGVEDEACHLVANKLQQLSKADQDGRLVILPSEDYTFTVRGDIARELIIANCRAAANSEKGEENA